MIYSPAEDSFLLEEIVRKKSKNQKILDVGCGSGIQMRAAINSGAKSVLGIDIDSESLKLCKKSGLKVKKSNLFSNVKGKFDLIIFNPPYLPKDEREDVKSARATSGGKNGDEIILRFLKKAPKFLEKDGSILLLISSLTLLLNF